MDSICEMKNGFVLNFISMCLTSFLVAAIHDDYDSGKRALVLRRKSDRMQNGYQHMYEGIPVYQIIQPISESLRSPRLYKHSFQKVHPLNKYSDGFLQAPNARNYQKYEAKRFLNHHDEYNNKERYRSLINDEVFGEHSWDFSKDEILHLQPMREEALEHNTAKRVKPKSFLDETESFILSKPFAIAGKVNYIFKKYL